MGYEGSEGLAQMVHIQGRRLSNPDLCPLGQDHSALSSAHDNDSGQRTYLKKPVEEGSLPGVGRTRDRAEAGLEHTTPSGAPKAVLLSGGEGIPCPKREMEALGHVQNQGGRRGMAEAGARPGEQEGHSPSSVMVTFLPQMHPH